MHCVVLALFIIILEIVSDLNKQNGAFIKNLNNS